MINRHGSSTDKNRMMFLSYKREGAQTGHKTLQTTKEQMSITDNFFVKIKTKPW